MRQRTTALLVLAVSVFSASLAAGEAARSTWRGEVVEVGPRAKDKATPSDRPESLALRTSDGTLHPLLQDPGSRAFFEDARLRHTPVQLNVADRPGQTDLQVVGIQRRKDGKLFDVDYWCKVCSIALPWRQKCPCCQAEMELRERQAK